MRPFTLFIVILVCTLSSCNKTHVTGNSGNTNDSVNSPINISITSISPTNGPYQTIDTITASGLDKIGAPDSVLINGHKLMIIRDSVDQVVVQIPLLAGTGNVDLWYKGKMYQGPIFTYDSVLYVTTIAGTIEQAEADGKGQNARFDHPIGIAVDHVGNVYVAEDYGNTIRKIDTGGNVTTLAGTSGLQEQSKDGTGAAAILNAPYGLCLAPDGCLYVGEEGGWCIRKVSLTGVVTTFAGAYWNGMVNDGATDGPPSVATFNTPFGVSSDKAGNIYVADLYNNKIRKVAPTGTVSSLAGGDYYTFGHQDGKGSAALFYYPRFVASDSAGTIYVLDAELEYLRKITPDGTVTTLLGPYVPALTGIYDLFNATGVTCDKYGNVFFAISGGIVKMTPDGTLVKYAISGVAGYVDGPVPLATFGPISGIVVDDAGTLYITDENRVRKIAWQ